MSQLLVVVDGIGLPVPPLLAAARHTLYPTTMAPPAGVEPTGEWAQVPFSGCAWPSPWTKARLPDAGPRAFYFPKMVNFLKW